MGYDQGTMDLRIGDRVYWDDWGEGRIGELPASEIRDGLVVSFDDKTIVAWDDEEARMCFIGRETVRKNR